MTNELVRHAIAPFLTDPNLEPDNTPEVFLNKKIDERSAVEKLADQEWRLENLYFITDKDGKIVKFKLNPVQRYLLKNLHTRNIILKARQLGMSTFIAILFLDICLFEPNTNAAIIADKIENGKNIFKKIEFAWSKFSKALKESKNLVSTSDSSVEISWTNGSAIKVGTTIHSGTYQLLHVSEYGPLCQSSPEKASDVKKSALPTVAAGKGLVFIESTAEGEGNDFHKMCMDAQELEKKIEYTKVTPEPLELSKMQYKFFFFPWFDDENYTTDDKVVEPHPVKKYLDEMELQLNRKFTKGQRAWYTLMASEQKDRMREQYPSTPEEAFLSTGNKQFNPDILNTKFLTEVRAPVFIDGDLFIYEHYRRGHMYGLGADVGDGVGLDSSTIVVIDFTVMKVVATYKSSTIDPVNFAYEIQRVGNMYGVCIAAPENARAGTSVCITLNGIYPNLYKFEIQGNVQNRVTERLGWSTNAATKPLMMAELKSIVEMEEEQSLIIPDEGLIREMRMYAKDDNIATAEQQRKTTRHFDLLIACAIAWQMRKHTFVSMNTPKQVARMNHLRRQVQAGGRRFR